MDTQEVARHWLGVLKSAPWKDHWVIDDDRFLANLAATWPWIMAYFEFLSRAGKAIAKEDFSLIVKMAVGALRHTLDIRLDCAAYLFLLFLASRRGCVEENAERICKSIDTLCQGEDDREWQSWVEGLWGRQ